MKDFLLDFSKNKLILHFFNILKDICQISAKLFLLMLSQRASNPNIRVYSTINFAPRRPADFVNFRGAGRGGAIIPGAGTRRCTGGGTTGNGLDGFGWDGNFNNV